MEVKRFPALKMGSGTGWIDCVLAEDNDRVTAERDALQQRLNAVEEENDRLRSAAQKVIDMNRQHAEDKYGCAEKAEAWSCVAELRAALENRS